MITISDRSIAATFQSLPGASFVVNGGAQASDSALVTAAVEKICLNGWSAEGEFSDMTRSYAGKGGDTRGDRAVAGVLQKPDLLKQFKLFLPVQSSAAKIFPFPFDPNHLHIPRRPGPHRGAFRDRHGRRAGMRWT